MRKNITLLLCISLLALPYAAKAEKVQQITFFYTGNSYLEAKDKYADILEGVEEFYIAGINDAMSFYSGDRHDRLKHCSTGKTSTQLAAIFNKWLDKNEKLRSFPVPMLYQIAILEACESL